MAQKNEIDLAKRLEFLCTAPFDHCSFRYFNVNCGPFEQIRPCGLGDNVPPGQGSGRCCYQLWTGQKQR